MNGTRGFILIIVISLIALFAFIGLYFVNATNQNKEISRTYINKIKSDNLALSGFNYIFKKYLEDPIEFDHGWVEKNVGEGSYSIFGDVFQVKAQDINGKINVNDGIKAGQLMDRVLPFPPIPMNYHANAIDPYPNDSIRDPVDTELGVSGFINLRLRRLLNAFGDVHRFMDQVYKSNIENVDNPKYYNNPNQHPLPNPVFSTQSEIFSADGRRGLKMAHYISGTDEYDLKKNTGLGDQIIINRPPTGYSHLEDIRDIVNQWADNPYAGNLSMIRKSYLKSGDFFDIVKKDLTVTSYEDTQFFQLKDETKFGQGLYDQDQPGDFNPIDVQFSFPKLDDLWDKHSVSVINLNQASFYVRAAVFYAPTHVTYSCQGATTVPPYIVGSGSMEYFPPQTGSESMIAYPNIGVIGAIFDYANNKQTIENGQPGKGRQYHLMSLTDAMRLAKGFQQYKDLDQSKHMMSFDAFKEFLVWYETNGQLGHNIPAYEKVSTKLSHEPFDLNYDFNAGGLFGVCEYDQKAVFTQDYVSHTLPHIFSCIRRIPSWFGAPAALQSPYFVFKPDVDRQSYWMENKIARQGFIKVEDFVWRAQHPKISFIPLGTAEFTSIGQVKNIHNEVISRSQLSGTALFFDTRIYRTQERFATIGNYSFNLGGGNKQFLIGPDYFDVGRPPIDPPFHKPHDYLGFIGLSDFADDVFYDGNITGRGTSKYYDEYNLDTDDTFMSHQGGYMPQIIMNFDYASNAFDNEAPNSSSSDYEKPSTDDSWKIYINDPETIIDPKNLENPRNYSGYFSGIETIDASPFNGAFLSSIRPITAAEIYFNDPLYYRLNEWFEPYVLYPDPVYAPSGDRASKGIMTFWFQLPSVYDYPTSVGMNGNKVSTESFSRTLVNLNLWEAFEYAFDDGGGPYIMERPISLTVGLRKNKLYGLNIFVRYDSGFEHHNMTDVLYQYDGVEHNFGYIEPALGENGILIAPIYNELDSKEYSTLGFWCDNNETQRIEPPLSYNNYFSISHKSYQLSVPFDNKPENGPGSWHRASVYWNFKYSNNQSKMKSSKQLFLDLHDNSNKKTISFNESVMQDVVYAPSGYDPQTQLHFDYPRKALRGLMLPYNSVRSLSLGDSHARRLSPYTFVEDEEERQLEIGQYYPYWRLNSCIDNFRFHMRSSDPRAPDPIYRRHNNPPDPISDDFFKEKFIEKNAKANPYGALRYNITREGIDGFEKTNEPTFFFRAVLNDSTIPNRLKLVSIGSRIYYPPDSNNNVPYVHLFAQEIDGSEVKDFEISRVSQNEQHFFYAHAQTNEKLNIGLRYIPFKPTLDGDLSNMEAEPVVYYGEDNCTDIPWIKELNIRYATSEHPQILELSPMTSN